MDRLRKWLGTLAALLVLAAILATASGCVSALTTALYLIKGTDVPAAFPLKGKKVCVVCRTAGNLQYQNATAGRDLARLVNRLLRENIKKVEVTDQRKVEAWTDENMWSEFDEVGKAMDVEIVIAIDLENFTLYTGQTLFQGNASTRVKAVDVATGDALFEKLIPELKYPPNAVMTTMDIQEPEFRGKFLAVLADRIGRNFYSHDSHADYAMDSTIDD